MRHSQLKAFHAVAYFGGFSRAAKMVHLSQPVLSEHVKTLERDYDILLFNRDGKQTSLTKDGESLFQMTEQFFEFESKIKDYLSESSSSIEGTLRIIVDSAYHVTEILQRFRQKHPKVFVSIRTGNSIEVLQALRAYSAEIGIVGAAPTSKEFQTVDLGATSIIAFAAKDFFTQLPPPLVLQDLAKLPLVFREHGSRTRQKLEQKAAAHKIKLHPVIEVEGREAMREVVASGAGIGFVSEAEFGEDSRLIRLDLNGINMKMHETLVYVQQRKDVRLINAFMKFV